MATDLSETDKDGRHMQTLKKFHTSTILKGSQQITSSLPAPPPLRPAPPFEPPQLTTKGSHQITSSFLERPTTSHPSFEQPPPPPTPTPTSPSSLLCVKEKKN